MLKDGSLLFAGDVILLVRDPGALYSNVQRNLSPSKFKKSRVDETVSLDILSSCI